MPKRRAHEKSELTYNSNPFFEIMIVVDHKLCVHAHDHKSKKGKRTTLRKSITRECRKGGPNDCFICRKFTNYGTNMEKRIGSWLQLLLNTSFLKMTLENCESQLIEFPSVVNVSWQ